MGIGAGICLVPSYLPSDWILLLQDGTGPYLLPYHRWSKPSVFIPPGSALSRPLTPALRRTPLYFSRGTQKSMYRANSLTWGSLTQGPEWYKQPKEHKANGIKSHGRPRTGSDTKSIQDNARDN